jgi:hypothetical protein
MSRAYRFTREKRNVYESYLGNLNDGYHIGDLAMDGRIILK